MRAYLVLETDKGKEVERKALESRGESKSYKKFGIGQFDRRNGSDPVVVSVYYDMDDYSTLATKNGEAVE